MFTNLENHKNIQEKLYKINKIFKIFPQYLGLI